MKAKRVVTKILFVNKKKILPVEKVTVKKATKTKGHHEKVCISRFTHDATKSTVNKTRQNTLLLKNQYPSQFWSKNTWCL